MILVEMKKKKNISSYSHAPFMSFSNGELVAGSGYVPE